jgi:hydroxyacylglutathione hydrolase
MDLELFQTPDLGDSSYLVASGGEAALVDPQRDAWRFVEAARQRGWRIRYVLETHVHNDYLSGALETRTATGAEIAAPARGRYEFEHRPIDEGDAIELGDLRLTAWATPGHTPEHIAWLAADIGRQDAPRAVFTGGSLLVGSVGRTDLLGPALTDALTRDQQRSLQRLATLPSSTKVLPTHGAGSFCSAGPVGGERTSTIAAEEFANPGLRLADADPELFRTETLAGLGRFPAYYAQMSAINRRGPRVLGGIVLPPALDPAGFEASAAAGVTIVDARDRATFARGHIRGSLNIELGAGAFAGYVGWLVPFAHPVLLVLPDAPDALAEATTDLLRIGYERIRGWLDGGVAAWEASGRPLASYPTTTMAAVAGARAAGGDGSVLLDVRQPIEWQDEGVVPGSSHVFVADLAARIGELPADEPVTVFCRSGHRASIAASILEAAGREVRLVVKGGAGSWPEPLEPLEPVGGGR